MTAATLKMGDDCNGPVQVRICANACDQYVRECAAAIGQVRKISAIMRKSRGSLHESVRCSLSLPRSFKEIGRVTTVS